MDVRLTIGDHNIGDIVCMVLDKDRRGMVTGIQFRDKSSFLYMVTYLSGDTAMEIFQLPIEIRKCK